MTLYEAEIVEIAVIEFQSSLLRCSYCDEKGAFGRAKTKEVSILFTEVFLL